MFAKGTAGFFQNGVIVRTLIWAPELLFIVIAAASARAATNTSPTTIRTWSADPIVGLIASEDPQRIQQAIVAITDQLHGEPRTSAEAAVGLTSNRWLSALMSAERYDDVARLSLEGILALPRDTHSVEALQKLRVQALLRMRRPGGLAAAKSLFNVCHMRNAADSLMLVTECLKVAYPDDDTIGRQFIEEQVAGAKADTAGSQSSVLANIKIDGSLYDKAIKGAAGQRYGDLVALGNLLLLADRPREAQTVFERAYGIAPTNRLAAATENVVRCIKAEDGTIGRANAWVLSIRP
jgi:hypothetical protein